ncbi:MAG: hypothetical protein U0636_08920 [Phycisphaerales bacterium]
MTHRAEGMRGFVAPRLAHAAWTSVLGAAGMLACTAAATADFTGWTAEVSVLASGRYAMNVYANFSSTGDRLLNVWHVTAVTSTAAGYYQDAANPFWAPGLQSAQDADDSYVTIGTDTSAMAHGNGVIAGDPDFLNFDDSTGATDFSVFQGPNGPGWYLSNPTLPQGLATSGRVLAAHLVAANVADADVQNVQWSASLSAKLANGVTHVYYIAGTAFGSETFSWGSSLVPAPGLLGLLSVAGVACRHRRRSV